MYTSISEAHRDDRSLKGVMAGFSNQGFSSPKGLHQSSSSNSMKVSSGAGLATSKTVMYKRRRASRRVPTTILETSCQEFRDAVQKLTGFHRPTPSAAAAASPKPQPPKPRARAMPSYEQVDHDEDDAGAAHPSSSSPQSALSDPELPHGEFFHHFLRESSGSPRSSNSKPVDAASAATSRAPFAALANMRAAAAYRQQQGPFGHGVAPFWENAFGSSDASFMGSLAKLQDPGMAPNPYLMALENQLLAKFARRMQMAATSNPLDHPWYQMDHMPPLRA